MIPTGYRKKLPRHLSYPIGAEAVSEALAGAPHVERLSISFYGTASGFRRMLASGRPLSVMSLDFSPSRKPGIGASNQMIQDGWYDERWRIWVYPVLAEHRHLANRLIREVGLPAVAAWLKSSHRAGWDMTSQWVRLEFDPAGESLTPKEGRGP